MIKKTILLLILLLSNYCYSQNTTGIPTISGDFSLGSVLTADVSNLKDEDGIGSFKYQWYKDDELITDATASSYKLTLPDLKKGIKVIVEHTDLLNNIQYIESRPLGLWGQYQYLSEKIKNAQAAVVRITASTAVMILSLIHI